ncbi:two-component sensor histidine kinase [Mycolicibacterium sp. P1-18]|uniref:sensor histidine kinase n=1 Tax=Mycolicibacterium sp. P1-18 TaxID=2024615 RepID=UPI0011F352FB|nr:histidine kinase [Mycolicibacterium sp. P1-18]KAA0101382.1 two-component sensor histidine kinase [Mycolicibacterium sp. P1-18]
MLLLASTFPGRFHVPGTYWLLSLAAAVVFVAGRWQPVAASVILSALAVPLFAAEAWGVSGLVPYLGAVAVADVAARSERNQAVVVVTAAWLAALLLGSWLDAYATPWSATNAVTLVAGVGLPVLLGLYLRGQRRLATIHRERLDDAEARRAAGEVAVRAEERTAMARELHDLVAHHMASIVVRIGVADHVLDDVEPTVAAVLSDVHDTAADALADIRRLQVALRDPVLSKVAMIEPEAVWAEIDTAVGRTRAAGFTVSAHVDRQSAGLDAIARLTLLRVTQEALTNVMKHADPSSPVDVRVEARGAGVSIRIASTATPGPSPHVDGHGIIGMTERLSLVGGRFDVRRSAEDWVVEAWLPTSTAATDVPR